MGDNVCGKGMRAGTAGQDKSPLQRYKAEDNVALSGTYMFQSSSSPSEIGTLLIPRPRLGVATANGGE